MEVLAKRVLLLLLVMLVALPPIHGRSLHDEASENPFLKGGARNRRQVEEEPDVQEATTCTAPVCESAKDLPEWIQVLYQGVTQVPRYDNFGDILVYGDHAFPLLKMVDRDVTIMAGAEVGNGRVLAASHDGYGTLFKDSFMDNAVSQDPPTCRLTVGGAEYQGTINVTAGGLACQRWMDQTPHAHSDTDASQFPDNNLYDASNYCRNPGGTKVKPWCYTTDPNKAWDYCQTPLCPGVTQNCRDTDKGTEYMGTVNVTVSGRTCQAWASQTPHSHHYMTRTDFPDDNYDNLHNYCRNAGGGQRPWCYTTDPNKRWEDCDTPMCPTCRTSVLGTEYDGDVSVTVGGVTCQSWAEQTPHAHSYTDINSFPDSSFDDLSNSCRNPGGVYNKPWCYTTDSNKQWDYCGTPVCNGVTQECSNTAKGTEYMGTKNVTISGYTCQAWASQSPHSHNYKNIGGFPDGSYDDLHNYCRNPGGDQQTWCYTTDPNKRWDWCDVPVCPGEESQLALNTRKWLTKGQYQGEHNVCYLDSESSMSCLNDPNVKILVWQDTHWAQPDDEAAVLSWVQGGGSLLWVMKAWVWQIYRDAGKAGKSYQAMPFYNVIEEAGMAFVYDWYKTPELPAPTSADDLDKLKLLNHKYLAYQIQTVADSDVHAAWIDKWMNRVTQSESQWLYPELIDTNYEIMAIVGNALQDKMPWPTGSVANEVSVPVSTADQRMFDVYYLLGLKGYWKDKATNVEYFPGDITDPVPTETHVFELSTTEENTWPTGVYLLPGQPMHVEILSSGNTQYAEFEILIGCHTDSLTHKTDLYRFPKINRWVKLDSTTQSFTVQHVHGGLVQVRSRKSTVPNYIKVSFSGVIKAPYFNLADPASIAAWSERRNAPGLWADIVGRRSRFTVPAVSVRDMEAQHLQDVMEAWDEVVTHSYWLKGQPEDQWRMQWASSDIQISVGSLHAGYPIGMHLNRGLKDSDIFVLNGDLSGQWGMFHEIGHNLQEWSWTFADTLEVTNNIFSLFNVWRLYEHDPLTVQMNSTVYGWGYSNYLANPTYDNVWKKAWPSLLPYSQLATNFGFDCYHQVFSTYYDDEEAPQGDQAARDEWVKRWSHAVGYNICPVYDYFALPLTEAMCQSLPYEPYLPDDIVTQMPAAEGLVNQILTKYPGTVRTITTTPNCPPYDPTVQQTAAFALDDLAGENVVDDGPEESEGPKGRKKRLVKLLKRYLQTLEN